MKILQSFIQALLSNPWIRRQHGNPSPLSAVADIPEVNHEKLERGLKKYCRIQSMYWDVDTTKSREFQKLFNGFYRVRSTDHGRVPDIHGHRNRTEPGCRAKTDRETRFGFGLAQRAALPDSRTLWRSLFRDADCVENFSVGREATR